MESYTELQMKLLLFKAEIGSYMRDIAVLEHHLKAERIKIMNYMIEEGLLDDKFKQVLETETGGAEGFLTDVAAAYIEEGMKFISEIEKRLNEPVVDYRNVAALVFQLSGRCNSLCLKKAALACEKLATACRERNKERCVEACNEVDCGLKEVSKGFELVCQMDRQKEALDKFNRSIIDLPL